MDYSVQSVQSLSRVRLFATPWIVMDYYSAINGSNFELVELRWMNLEPVIQKEVSQKEKNKYCILTHIYRRRQWHPTPVLLPGKSHERRSLEGCSPWDHWGSDTTERLHFPFSLSCTGEGKDNPLQCSCLENPRDGGAWWAAVYGVAQSRIWLKWLSSCSSSIHIYIYIYVFLKTTRSPIISLWWIYPTLKNFNR